MWSKRGAGTRESKQDALQNCRSACEEVTLVLGAQLAIVFVGVNIVVPMLGSAVLALIVLITVRTVRAVKILMGHACTKDLVHELKNKGSANTPAPSPKVTAKTQENSIKIKDLDSETPGRWADLRKRRPSVVSATVVDSFSDSSPQPASSSAGSPTSREMTPSASSKMSHRRGPRRFLSSTSSSRISPLSSPSPPPKREPDTWAWLEGSDVINRNVKKRQIKRKTSDLGRVLSPSECYVDGLDAEYQPVFANDMEAYEIW